MSKEDREYREEGRKAFISNPYAIDQNPYGMLGGVEEIEKRRQWQKGWNDAKATGD